MSKIRLHGSSSGYTEIAPVAASGNNTLTLPNDGTIISQDSNGAVGVTSITVGTGVTIGDGRVTCSTLHGSAANCTQIPAANIVGICTAGFERTGGFGGITMCDQWRITSSVETNSSYLTSNWERTDNPASTILLSGGGMTESSGVFSFPSTGIYLILATTRGYRGSNVSYAGIQIEPTTNNSSYSNMADGFSSVASANYYFHASAQLVFDVSDTSTHKLKIKCAADGNTYFSGDSNVQMTGATFIRLGDT